MGQSAGKASLLNQSLLNNTVSFTDLPVEILDQVFSNLSQKDKKAVNGTCACFRQAVQSMLWSEPALTLQMDWDDLKLFANKQLPVKVLKLSQISPKICLSSEMDELCESSQLEKLLDLIIANFKSLTEFRMDYKRQDSLQPQLQRDKESLTDHLYIRKLLLFKQFLRRLPVSHIDSAVVFKGYLDNYTLSESAISAHAYMSARDFIEDVLLKADHCTSIFIDEYLHGMLSLEHWQQLVGLPITEMRANFYRRPEDFDDYLTEYDNVVGQLSPFPNYKLVYRRQSVTRLCPRTIARFCHVRITEIDLDVTNRQINLKEYSQSLRRNEQAPHLLAHGIPVVYDIDLAGFACLAEQCPFDALDSGAVSLYQGNIDQFVDVVIDCHQRSPIHAFTINSRQKHLFKRSHRKKLQSVGLNYSISRL